MTFRYRKFKVRACNNTGFRTMVRGPVWVRWHGYMYIDYLVTQSSDT